MRSMWKGSISFGLVNIPIQLYTATSEEQVRFTLLHRVCRTPIKYVKTCPHCDVPVEQAEIVRGYAYEPDRYVLMEDEELQSLPLPTLKTIDILHFVSLHDVDPIHFGKTYYIEPQERAEKAYALLHAAMSETGKVAIAKVTLRNKESLAAVRIYEHLLALELMYYPNEIRSADRLRGVREAPAPRESETTVAHQLIESLSVPFDPTQYEDTYREALLQRIEEKISDEEGVVVPERPTSEGIEDLLAALEASLAQVKASPNGEDAPEVSDDPNGAKETKARGKKTPAVVR